MKVSNVVDKAHESLDNIVSYANDNKERIFKDIVNGILIFIILAIFGCFDFVTFSFHPEYLATWSYWTRVISKAIAGICSYHIGINLAYDREIAKDKQLEEQAKKYERLLKLKDDRTFNIFVLTVFNKKQKKKAYVSYINRKLYLLNKFARNKDKLMWTTENEDLKSRNRYCRKRKELEMLKTDEYIDKNIDSINVKYNQVDPILFDLGLDAKSKFEQIKVKGNVKIGKAKLTSSVFIGIVGISSFMASLGLDANQQQFVDQMQAFWHYLLVCCEDIGLVCWQIIRGIFDTRKLISSEISAPLVGRNIVLESYVNYCAENNIEKTKSYMIYQKILESEKANENLG